MNKSTVTIVIVVAIAAVGVGIYMTRQPEEAAIVEVPVVVEEASAPAASEEITATAEEASPESSEAPAAEEVAAEAAPEPTAEAAPEPAPVVEEEVAAEAAPEPAAEAAPEPAPVVEEEAAAAADPAAERVAAADPAAGEAVAQAQCGVCHSLDEGGATMIGPNLFGIVGDDTAARDFAYSDALQALGGTWSYGALDAFLASPQEFAAGTTMPFGGLPDEADRANLIAYLRANDGAPEPLPGE